MKVFISWSGEYSRNVALALHRWLPGVINQVKPFVSAKDIYAGSRWQAEIAKELESTDFGIVCVTKANQAAPWLNFEAGALAKAVESSRVVPLAIDLKPSDIGSPLGQFQAQPADEAGVAAMMQSINQASENPLNEELLGRSISRWWPDLEEALAALQENADAPQTPRVPVRSERELLEEVLDTVRGLSHERRREEDAVEIASSLAHRLRMVSSAVRTTRSGRDEYTVSMHRRPTQSELQHFAHVASMTPRRVEVVWPGGSAEWNDGERSPRYYDDPPDEVSGPDFELR